MTEEEFTDKMKTLYNSEEKRYQPFPIGLGESISIQAGKDWYSTPKEDHNSFDVYSAVEVSVGDDEFLQGYLWSYTGGSVVATYVPVEILVEALNARKELKG